VGGIPVQVLDTAGIRETSDQVEQIGVERSQQAAQSADLILLTMDAAQGWTEAEQGIYEQIQTRPFLLVINKIDLNPDPIIPSQWQFPPRQVVSTSAIQSLGIDRLETALLTTVQGQNFTAANLDIAINQRQAAALTAAKNALLQVQGTIAAQLPLDFWTIDLRTAIYALGEITGEEVTESLLDRIFSRFCIGK